MNRPVINKQILSAVFEKISDDHLLQQFIKEMLFEELEHPSQWWFKDHYKKKIREYSDNWAKNNENQQNKA